MKCKFFITHLLSDFASVSSRVITSIGRVVFMIRVFLIIALTSLLFSNPVLAEEEMKIKIVSYQPPADLLQYLNQNAPDGIIFNNSDWISISEADIFIYFMSSFDARHEITEFGSRILDTIDVENSSSAIVTQSFNVGGEEKVRQVVFVSASMLDGSPRQINCNTSNVVNALLFQESSDNTVEFKAC